MMPSSTRNPRDALPDFDLDEYLSLLRRLKGSGYHFRTIEHLPDRELGPCVYLRHDVDLHLSLVLEMAILESVNGFQATYFVPLTAHFNPLYPPNLRVVRQLRNSGHQIGLHYDLSTYPAEPDQARKHLIWEAGILSQIVGEPIRSIALHEPYVGRSDPFRRIDEFVNSHDPRYQEDLLYVSDSCRAWRDESLLRCLGLSPPRRLLLNIHPELWLDGSITNRMVYLERVLIERGLHQHRTFFDETVRHAWQSHPAPRAHDEREKERSVGGQ